MIRKLLTITVGVMLAATTAFAEGSIEFIKQRGEVIVGVRYDMPPFGYIAEGGSVIGVDIAIAEEVATKLGVTLRTVQVTAQSRIPMLQNGSIDFLAAGIAHTEEREKVVDFSATYFESGTLFLVKEDSKASSYRDFEGGTIATVQGTPYLPLLTQTGLNFGTLTFQEYPQAMLAVANGKADALMADDATLATILQQTKGLKIIGSVRDFPSWHIGLAVQKGNTKLRDFLNTTLVDMWKNGQLQEAFGKQGLRYELDFEIRP